MTDVMGDSWLFTPLSAPSLARLGALPNTRQPVCGAPRTAVLDTLGAGTTASRALTWTDPQDSGVRYWVQYNDKADERADGGAYVSPWQVPRTISGVQILRSAGGGGELLQRPGDDSIGNEFVLAGETVPLNTGMSLEVDAIDAATRKATVTVTVPCTEYVGNITSQATVSASYTSPWSTAGAAADDDKASAWSTWPRVGEQHLELRWPTTVAVDSTTVRFASDAADGDRRGLIPARSWRVEYFNTTTSAWTPVANASTGGRERNTPNVVSFSAVNTTAVRILFQAWGSEEYAGSTGVAELEVNGVTPVASLVARGVAATVPTSASQDLSQSVSVLDASGRSLPGRAVTFAISGPATFANGTKTSSVVSGANGDAVLPPVRTGTATGTVSIAATVPGLTPAVLARTTVAAPPSVSATTSPRKVSGIVSLAVTAKNTGKTTTDITMVTAYGTATFTRVAPGASVSRTFTTRKSTIPAGSAQVTATTNELRTTVTAAYKAM